MKTVFHTLFQIYIFWIWGVNKYNEKVDNQNQKTKVESKMCSLKAYFLQVLPIPSFRSYQELASQCLFKNSLNEMSI